VGKEGALVMERFASICIIVVLVPLVFYIIVGYFDGYGT
jgi:hypothetical protein